MAEWSQQFPRTDGTLTKEDWIHIRALLGRHDLQTIQSALAEYAQWSRYSLLNVLEVWPTCPAPPDRQSMSSTQTSSTGYLSVGKSSIESGASSAQTADTLLSSTRSQFGRMLAKPNAPRICFCTYHEELGLPTIFFGRKAECKNHMMNFHNLGRDPREWKCPTCLTIFDRENDYTRHNRIEHARQPVLPPTEVVVNILPKQVFACGFQGCENLYTSSDEWFDHITGHMKEGKAPSDWSYNTVIGNLLRQRDLRDYWERMLRAYSTTQHTLNWEPGSARQLCQKLECRDFRPGIQSLVKVAYFLGLRGDTMQIGFETPNCDLVPPYEDNDHLDRILMRPGRPNSTSTSVIHDRPPQQPLHIFEGGQARGNNFELMDISSVLGPSSAAQSHVGSYQSSASLQCYEQTQIDQYTRLSSPAFNADLSHPPECFDFDFDFDFSIQSHPVDNSHGPNRDPQSGHILQEFQYYDYQNFARANTPRQWTPGALIRRARSSMSLSSKKSLSSLEADPTQTVPPVPPVPPVPVNSIMPPGRSRSSSFSQRSRPSRKTGQEANPFS